MVDILAEYWRFRAEKARNMVVEGATVDEVHEELRAVAVVYDYLADLAAHVSPPARAPLTSAWQLGEIVHPGISLRPRGQSRPKRRLVSLH
jgi:hypothetical protein